MSKQAEAELILRLYELRREETMRKAREWYFREFNPESLSDYTNTLFGEHSGHLRMVSSYWDMAAALVNQGAISLDMFANTNSEHLGVFAKQEPILADIRGTFAPQYLVNLETVIDATPGGRERVAAFRERAKRVRAEMKARQSQPANQA